MMENPAETIFTLLLVKFLFNFQSMRTFNRREMMNKPFPVIFFKSIDTTIEFQSLRSFISVFYLYVLLS